MIILALDLAYSGPTGWVVWDTDSEDPVVRYGTITPRDVKKGQERWIVVDLYNMLTDLMHATPEYIETVAYEITDWHRTLKGKKFDMDYFIERQAQRTLGRAESAVILMAAHLGKYSEPIGANEAKKEFGAVRKDACARLFSQEFKRFKFIDEADENAKEFLFDTKLNQPVPHHVSDAFVIAKVYAARAIREERASA